MNTMRSFMADAKDFTEFRNKCFDAGFEFNQVWLRTEFDTFTAAAQMGKQYDNFITNGIDVLEFTTAGDERVRESHAELDGLTFRIDASFARKIWPPLDWNCRCHLVPGIGAKINNEAEAGALVKQAAKNPLFNTHPGVDKVVVSDNHPYFNAMPKELDARKNYGLPSVKHLYNQNSYPARIEMASESEYNAWWKDMVNINRTDNFFLQDKTGLTVLFDSPETPGNNSGADNYFKSKILIKKNEERWAFAGNIPDIITDADEIWSIRYRNKLQRYYIKYYDNKPLVIVVVEEDNIIKAKTMFEMEEEAFTRMRKGELIFIKR